MLDPVTPRAGRGRAPRARGGPPGSRPETANDGCARAWEKLLARPDVELDHRGVKWLETVAVREAWRDAGPANEMERLDAEVLEGETVGDRLVGRDDDDYSVSPASSGLRAATD